ncbi:hypothetical protein PTKIN_Ptkin03bG0222000 [Pterospermum kingtungense]
MLGKRPRPMIGKLSELLVSGNKNNNNKPGFLDVATTTSPRSPLDFKTPSPRGLKIYDVGGVGLGIVAALDKSICSSSLNRSNAIVISPGKNCDVFRGRRYGDNSELESLEDYTYVTSHGPGKSSSTKVYYDAGHDDHQQRRSSSSSSTSTTRHDTNKGFGAVKEDHVVYPTSDFLSSCHLCRKKLHGKDIYMYRGEKGFCSTECRSTQIMMDERKEQCRSEAHSRSAKVSTNTGQIFSTGILAI